jgi:hypothetical protein
MVLDAYGRRVRVRRRIGFEGGLVIERDDDADTRVEAVAGKEVDIDEEDDE